MYSSIVKPGFDFMLAAVSLIMTLPICILIAVSILVADGLPILFIQDRVGKGGRIFSIVKFKTISLKNGVQQPTSFGTFLRRTGLDEIPQLLNILVGHMSFVGPRPLLPEYLNRYTTEQRRRHEVKPGMTGLAQVNGRNAIPWEKRFKYDVKYVEQQSLWLDLKVLLKTPRSLLTKKGSEPSVPFLD